jgi:16S rRNA (uracil1498-N3)-methyltransferase
MPPAEAPPPGGRHRFHVTAECLQEATVQLTGEQARQISRVLRLRAGDAIGVFDGGEREYQVTLEVVTAEAVAGRITAQCRPQTESPCRLWIAVPLLKSDKLEWVVQKSVELGVAGILLTRTRRTIVQTGEERAANRLERYRRIAREATEQCGRLAVPPVEGPVPWPEAVERSRSFPLALIAHGGAPVPLRDAPAGHLGVRSAVLFTGPEGGFAPEEVAAAESAGVQPVSLGARILRAETAALAGIVWLLAVLEEALVTPCPGARGLAAPARRGDTPAGTGLGTGRPET